MHELLFHYWATFSLLYAYSNKQYCVILGDIFMFKVMWLYSKLEYTYKYKKNNVAWATFLFILAYSSNNQHCVIVSNIFMFKVMWLYSKLEYTYQYKQYKYMNYFCDLLFFYSLLLVVIRNIASSLLICSKLYGCTPSWSTLINTQITIGCANFCIWYGKTNSTMQQKKWFQAMVFIL